MQEQLADRAEERVTLLSSRTSGTCGSAWGGVGAYSQSRFLKMTYRLVQTTAISRIAKG
ncbi:hypothetical protein M2167_003620 [Streptomyces sp. SPB4]|nr:hypothetical protein [Streptomyces sp. SPB4]